MKQWELELIEFRLAQKDFIKNMKTHLKRTEDFKKIKYALNVIENANIQLKKVKT